MGVIHASPYTFSQVLSTLNLKDRSNIPSTEEELNRTLPVRAPFFVNSRNISLATGGVRATWLGHATVLAEVGSAVVLADPQFSVYASFVQWAGTKR